ncbi:MAG: nuclear transport factor 2 family protein [Candidatus Sulfotelmatobacter sp.]
MDRDKDKKSVKPSRSGAASDSESAPPNVGPENPALAEIYQGSYPEMRRPKPNQEAVAAALQAMQRLALEADSEAAAEDERLETTPNAQITCGVCGHHNREGNKFCGACGLPLASLGPDLPAHESSVAALDDEAPRRTPPPPLAEAHEVHPAPGAPPAAHHYHHHYHHHYFQGGPDFAAAPRSNAPESAREADRLRVAAAAKGEPMSRSEAAVRRLTQEWVLACNTRQLDELIELYAADALVLRSNLPPIRGAMAVREFFFASLEAGLGEVAVEPMRVEVSGDLAHEVGRYSALVPGTVGKRREERGKYLWVFAKQANGDWKLVSECWSSDQTLTTAELDIPKAVISPGSKVQPRRS